MYTIGLLAFDGADVLDTGGPYEVFLTASRLAVRRGDDAPFDVVMLAPRPGTHEAYGGMRLQVAEAVGDRPSLDVFVVPGLIDVAAGANDAGLLDAIRTGAASASLVASVCTGSVLLAHAGVLDDVPAATTHFEDLHELVAVLGEDRVHRAPWVDAGRVVTAGGLSNGIGMALHLVERLAGRELAVATAHQIEYAWDPDDGLVIEPRAAEHA